MLIHEDVVLTLNLRVHIVDIAYQNIRQCNKGLSLSAASTCACGVFSQIMCGSVYPTLIAILSCRPKT